MKRILTIAMVGIAALFCIAIVTVYLSIGSVITTSVEKYGSAITQTTVSLRDADFSPSSGDASLLDLSVANPAAFSAKTALLAPRIEIQIDPQTVGEGVMVIKRMEIEAPEITYEINQSGDNLRALRVQIGEAVAAEKQDSFPDDKAGSPTKFIINDLYISNGVVVVEAEGLTGKRTTAIIKNLHLEDVGRDENGLAPAALVDKLYAPILQAVTIAALSTDLNLSDQALNILRAASDETEEAINRLRELLEN